MIVQVKNLVKRYGNLTALEHFGLEMEKGEIYGLLGPNGSGKTTAVHCMLSLLSYEKGSISLFGEPMGPKAYGIKRRIGAVFQEPAVFEELTVYENVTYFCSLYLKDREQIEQYAQEALTLTGLEDYRKFYPGKLSGGLMRRLSLACGIVHKPELLFADEPTIDTDPQSRSRILEAIQQKKEEGVSVLYTSHSIKEAEQLCDRLALMDGGRVVASGTKEELKGMISLGEKIRIRVYGLSGEQLNEIRMIPDVYFAGCSREVLTVKSNKGRHNLLAVLTYLSAHKLLMGEVTVDLPNLGDVFLEITGKELLEQDGREQII